MDQFRFSAVSATYVLITTFNYIFKRIFLKLDQSPKASETSCYLWQAVGTDMTDDGERIKFTRENWKVIASIYARKKLNKWTNSSNSDNNDLLNDIFRWSNPLPFYIPLLFFFYREGTFCLLSIRLQNSRAFSLPSLALCFQPRSRPFVWLLARTWIRKNTDCYAV